MKLDPEKVREARERLGFSFDALAKESGVSQTSAIRAEHGEEIRPLTARRLAKGLGVKVADLYPGKVPAPTSSLSESESDGERRVVDLSPEEFRQALAEASEAGAKALVDLYTRLDAERINAELRFRGDEDNRAAREDFSLAVERRMRLFLTLVGRGVTLDPEPLNSQLEKVEELQLH
jgi:transcriptional regulator with XRE-family HTH domain